MKLIEFNKPKLSDYASEYLADRDNTYGSDSSYDYTYDKKFEHKMAELGWKFLDNGKFASVFFNPKKNYVVKLTFREDTGYARYVRVLQGNPNPHFPKISAVKTLTFGETNYYIYLIERLYPISNKDRREYYRDSFQSILNFPKKSLKEIFRQHYDSPIPDILAENPKLVQALRIIGNNVENGWLDLHADNFMKRKDGTIVLTDPYSE
jgi:hypothetical protein